VAYVKDLWTDVVRDDSGEIVRNKKGQPVREKNERYGKGKRWLAGWIAPNGKERTRAFAIKTDAETHAKAMDTDASRGEYLDPKAGEKPLGPYLKLHLNTTKDRDPASYEIYEQTVRLHLNPTFEKWPVKNITVTDVLNWMEEFSANYGATTVGRGLHLLRSALDIAVDDGAIKRNPARSKSVKMPKRAATEITIWRDEELQGVLDFHRTQRDGVFLPIPVVGISCGARQGEIFALAEGDFDEDFLYIRRQIKKFDSGEHVFALPKNDKSREAPMPPETYRMLREHIDKHGTHPITLPWERIDGEPVTHNLIFVWTGPRYGLTHLRSRLYNELVWRPALSHAKLAPPPAVDARGRRKYSNNPRDGMHALRHYYASAMLADGVAVNELADYLGHSSAKVTLDMYAHLMPNANRRAVAAASAMLGRFKLAN
jgi:integrase